MLKINNLEIKDISLILVGLLCTIYLAKMFSLIFIPISLTFIFYSITNPIYLRIKKKVPYSKLAFPIILITLLVVLILLFTNQIFLSLESLYKEYAEYSQNLQNAFKNMANFTSPYISQKNIKELLSSQASSKIGSILEVLTVSTKNFLNMTLISMTLCLFVYQDRSISWIKKNHSQFIKKLEKSIRKYILVKIALSAITTVLIVSYLKVLDMNFILLVGALTFILNFIPSIGSILATIILIPIFSLEASSLIDVIKLLIFPSVTQFLIGNILEPKLMGQSLNIGPLSIILSLIFWSSVFGIYGLFLGVPLTVFCKMLITEN